MCMHSDLIKIVTYTIMYIISDEKSASAKQPHNKCYAHTIFLLLYFYFWFYNRSNVLLWIYEFFIAVAVCIFAQCDLSSILNRWPKNRCSIAQNYAYDTQPRYAMGHKSFIFSSMNAKQWIELVIRWMKTIFGFVLVDVAFIQTGYSA